jgi:predicted small metal-binding protein
MKVVNCRDVGVDCDFVARGETVEDVLRQCGEHARAAHGFADIPPEMVDKVKAAIREESSTTAHA